MKRRRSISKMIRGKGHLSCISGAITKGLKAYANVMFQFIIFNTFAKISKILFSLCRYVVLSLDL